MNDCKIHINFYTLNMKTIYFLVLSGAYNLGDECILRSEIDYFRARYPDAAIKVATYDKASFIGNTEGIEFVSYFPNNIRRFPIKNIWYFCKHIWATYASDLIVIGGWGIFFDNEPGVSFKKNLFEWKLRIFFARIFRKKILFLGISLEVKKEENQKILSKIFQKKDIILVRDRRSKEILEKYGVTSLALYDSVFLGPQEPLHTQKNITIAWTLRGWYLTERDIKEIQKALIYFDSLGYTNIFLSQSFRWDEHHNDILFVEKYFWKKYFITKNLEETLEYYKHISVMISMRLHGTILAYKHCVPTLMIAYGPKSVSLSEILGLQQYTYLPGSLDASTLSEDIKGFLTHYSAHTHSVSQKYKNLHDALIQELDSINFD